MTREAALRNEKPKKMKGYSRQSDVALSLDACCRRFHQEGMPLLPEGAPRLRRAGIDRQAAGDAS